jgi:hypothetical protein
MEAEQLKLTNPGKNLRVNLKVRITRRFKFRLWFGMLIVRLGVRITGAEPVIQTAQLAAFRCIDAVQGNGPFSNVTVHGVKTGDNDESVQLLTSGSLVERKRTGYGIRLVVPFDSCTIRKGDVFMVDGENA